jgi:hypothetical protein
MVLNLFIRAVAASSSAFARLAQIVSLPHRKVNASPTNLSADLKCVVGLIFVNKKSHSSFFFMVPIWSELPCIFMAHWSRILSFGTLGQVIVDLGEQNLQISRAVSHFNLAGKDFSEFRQTSATNSHHYSSWQQVTWSRNQLSPALPDVCVVEGTSSISQATHGRSSGHVESCSQPLQCPPLASTGPPTQTMSSRVSPCSPSFFLRSLCSTNLSRRSLMLPAGELSLEETCGIYRSVWVMDCDTRWG